MNFIVCYLLSVDWKLPKGPAYIICYAFAYTWNLTEDVIHSGCSQGVCHTNVCKQKTKAQKHKDVLKVIHAHSRIPIQTDVKYIAFRIHILRCAWHAGL